MGCVCFLVSLHLAEVIGQENKEYIGRRWTET